MGGDGAARGRSTIGNCDSSSAHNGFVSWTTQRSAHQRHLESVFRLNRRHNNFTHANSQHSFSIFRADVLAQLLSKPPVVAKSRCCAFVGGIHVSRMYDAVATADLFADDSDIHYSAVLWCW